MSSVRQVVQWFRELLLQGCVEEGVRREGSNLSGVSAVCSWKDGESRAGSGLTLPEVSEVAVTEKE